MNRIKSSIIYAREVDLRFRLEEARKSLINEQGSACTPDYRDSCELDNEIKKRFIKNIMTIRKE